MKVPEDFCQQVDSESDSESEAESALSSSSSQARPLSPCDPRIMKVPEDFCQQVDSESDSESEAESAASLAVSSGSSSSTQKTGFEHIVGAHRWTRLVWIEEGTKIKDEETGQCFDVIQFGLKNEKRNRLLPVFDKMPRDAWKLKFGFHMMKTYLKCIPPNCILWSKNNNNEMQQLEFLSCHFKAMSKIDVKCLDHDEVVQVRPHELKKGASLGCYRCCLQKRTWNNRFDEFKSMLPHGYELMIGRDEWKIQCKNSYFCPPIRCIKHPDRIITTTKIICISIGQGVGCMQCNNPLNTWKHRYDDFKSMLPSTVQLVTTHSEWKDECDSCLFKPTLKCLTCKVVVTTTRINDIHQGQSIGCTCRNKTETKFYNWLNDVCIVILKRDLSSLANVIVTPQACGPYVNESRFPTHYDVELTFDDGFKVRMEIDGEQHFDKKSRIFRMEGCHRDKAKEEHSIRVDKVPMIRVLQPDVWDDKNAWDDYCIRSIKKLYRRWKKGKAPRIVLPPGNRWEYCDPARSVYAQLRME